MLRRRFGERLFAAAAWAAALLLLGVLAWLLGAVAIKGIGQLSWSFLVTAPRNAGRAGGIAPVLASTLLVLLVALAAALPIGLGTAVWLAEWGRRHAGRARAVGLSLDVLAGVPSIVFGLFGNAFFCGFLGLGFSIWSGGLTLACMILPILIRTSEMGLAAVSQDWRRGAAALGMSRACALRCILLPAAGPAIGAGLVLAIGRATAETAALIFTSGYVDRMPESLSDSGRVLAVHIYDLSMNVSGGDAAANAAALVLMLLIVVVNAGAIGAGQRWLARKVVV